MKRLFDLPDRGSLHSIFTGITSNAAAATCRSWNPSVMRTERRGCASLPTLVVSTNWRTAAWMPSTAASAVLRGVKSRRRYRLSFRAPFPTATSLRATRSGRSWASTVRWCRRCVRASGGSTSRPWCERWCSSGFVPLTASWAAALVGHCRDAVDTRGRDPPASVARHGRPHGPCRPGRWCVFRMMSGSDFRG